MEISPEDYQRASDLFNDLLDVPAVELDAALDAACGPNQALRAEVLRLLEAERGAGSFLQRGALSDGAMMLRANGAAHTHVPKTIAHYKILSKLGQGGMGEVWRAHDSKLERDVAIKMLPAAFAADPELIARFSREAQVLALLNHPHIAAIHGVEERALVMELIDGCTLAAYAAEHSLGIVERMRLMATVCDAVHHAHQRGVLHRDLKPANILVDRSGQVKVLDFGVARILDNDSEATRRTDLGQLIGTLDYMSPEQTLGDPRTLDIRSDIYSLGVVLFELLAGRLPYQTKGLALPELLRVIREEDPPFLGILDRRLAGDIETMVNKALEKQKERRYTSAAEMGDDIRRYLANEPITAMPAGTAYLARKFVRRHRVGVTAAVLFLLLVIGFGIGMGILAARASKQRDIAERERARADAVADFLQNDVLAQADPGAQSGKSPDSNIRVRDALDRAAASIEGKFAGHPLVEAAIRQTIGETYSTIGLLPSAGAQFERALALRRKHLPRGSQEIVTTLVRLGQIRREMGSKDRCEPLIREAVETGGDVLGQENPVVLDATTELATLYTSRGNPQKAEELFRKVLAIRLRTLGPANVSTAGLMNDIANVIMDQGRTAEAEKLYLQSIDIWNKQPNPNLMPVYNLANMYEKQGEFEKAERYLEQARKATATSMNEEHPFRLMVMNAMASLYRDSARFDEAEKLFHHVWMVRRRVLGYENRNTLASAAFLGDLYCTSGRMEEGEKWLLEAVRTQRRVFGDEDRFTQRTLASLSLCYLRKRQFQTAGTWAETLAELRRKQHGASNPQTKDALMVLAAIRLRLGEITDADAILQEACPVAPPSDWQGFYCQSLQGESLAGAKQYARAEPLLLSGYRGMMEHRGRMPAGRLMHIADAKATLASLYQKWGKPELAAQWK